MNKSLSFRSYVALAAFIFFMSLPCFVGRGSVATARQAQDRILKKRSWSNEPVKIRLVNTKKRQIKLGEKFPDEDDWFEGLTLRIENISEKPIIFITVNLKFLRPANEIGLPFTHIMQYGQRAPTLKLEAVPSDQYPSILTGKFVDLRLSKQDYEAIKSSLIQVGFVAGIQRIDVTLGSVIFDDGTHWQTAKPRTDRGKSRLLDEVSIGSPIPSGFFLLQVGWRTSKSNWNAPRTPQDPDCGHADEVTHQYCPNRLTCVISHNSSIIVAISTLQIRSYRRP